MMKRIVIILIYVCCVTSILKAQQILVQEDIPILQHQTEQAYSPILDTSGTILLYSQANYKGLYSYNLKTKEQRVISDADGSGFDPVFSANSQTVYYKVDRPRDGRQYKLLMRYDYNSRKSAPVSKDLRSLNEIRKTRRIVEQTTMNQTACSEDLQLVVYRNGIRNVLDPVRETSGYIWVSVSPDKSKILFTAASKGTYVIDFDGNILANIGNMNSPVWFGNDMVVGMKDQDNGDYITKSVIWIQSLDKHINQPITPESRIALFPTASRETQQIVYQTDKGQLRLITLLVW